MLKHKPRLNLKVTHPVEYCVQRESEFPRVYFRCPAPRSAHWMYVLSYFHSNVRILNAVGSFGAWCHFHSQPVISWMIMKLSGSLLFGCIFTQRRKSTPHSFHGVKLFCVHTRGWMRQSGVRRKPSCQFEKLAAALRVLGVQTEPRETR